MELTSEATSDFNIFEISSHLENENDNEQSNLSNPFMISSGEPSPTKNTKNNSHKDNDETSPFQISDSEDDQKNQQPEILHPQKLVPQKKTTKRPKVQNPKKVFAVNLSDEMFGKDQKINSKPSQPQRTIPSVFDISDSETGEATPMIQSKNERPHIVPAKSENKVKNTSKPQPIQVKPRVVFDSIENDFHVSKFDAISPIGTNFGFSKNQPTKPNELSNSKKNSKTNNSDINVSIDSQHPNESSQDFATKIPSSSLSKEIINPTQNSSYQQNFVKQDIDHDQKLSIPGKDNQNIKNEPNIVKPHYETKLEEKVLNSLDSALDSLAQEFLSNIQNDLAAKCDIDQIISSFTSSIIREVTDYIDHSFSSISPLNFEQITRKIDQDFNTLENLKTKPLSETSLSPIDLVQQLQNQRSLFESKYPPMIQQLIHQSSNNSFIFESKRIRALQNRLAQIEVSKEINDIMIEDLKEQREHYFHSKLVDNHSQPHTLSQNVDLVQDLNNLIHQLDIKKLQQSNNDIEHILRRYNEIQEDIDSSTFQMSECLTKIFSTYSNFLSRKSIGKTNQEDSPKLYNHDRSKSSLSLSKKYDEKIAELREKRKAAFQEINTIDFLAI